MKVATFKFFDRKLDKLREISLSEGQSYDYSSGGNTEEGYDYFNCTFTLSGGVLRNEWSRDASDCDGPLNQYGDSYATFIDNDGTPEWIDGEFVQHDIYAEKMGY